MATTTAATLRFRHRDGSWVPLEALGKNLLHDPRVQGFIVNSRQLSGRF
jgi:hypothetical protein